MSCLAIYHPRVTEVVEEPAILKFPGTSRRGTHESAVLKRARLMHENSCCPECSSAAVDPIELNDALLNAQRRPIPGSATVVAFHCNRCYHEWPAH